MSKPTLSIGGTITAAEATELATLLAAWEPPMACEEGHGRPTYVEGHEAFLACITDAAQHAQPLHIGAWEQNDNLWHEASQAQIVAWLLDRIDRLTWRYFEPAAVDEDGEPYNGRIQINGVGRPDGVGEDDLCGVDHADNPMIHIMSLDYQPVPDEQLLAMARTARTIFAFKTPPLVIEG